MKEIPLTQGKVALVDDADYERLMQWKWHWHASDGYAYHWVTAGGKRTTIAMHRLLLDAPQGTQVDHRDGNGLNNQRSNLRLATNTQNCHNRAKRTKKPTSSQYKGVSWNAYAGKWAAQCERQRLGYFTSEIDAAHAYDTKAREMFGEFARTNFPD